jgi:hypothetical protein
MKVPRPRAQSLERRFPTSRFTDAAVRGATRRPRGQAPRRYGVNASLCDTTPGPARRGAISIACTAAYKVGTGCGKAGGGYIFDTHMLHRGTPNGNDRGCSRRLRGVGTPLCLPTVT